MMWLRKSKKGFTLVELMVVVAIIGILALLGLRLFLMQQIRAKNSIVKANTATVHTIIQGNLADTDYSAIDGIGNYTGSVKDEAAVVDVRDDDGELLDTNPGQATNLERPAGMKNPHLTADANLVIDAYDTDLATAQDLADLGTELAATWDKAYYAGVVIVAYSGTTANQFYIMGLDDNAFQLGEVYVATK